jgi:hypothetical protein
MLTIYEYLPDSEDMAKALATEAFTIMEVLDLDGDGYDDVFLVYLDSSTELTQAFAKKLKMQADGTVIIAGQARLDGNVGSYNEIKTEKVSDDYPCASIWMPIKAKRRWLRKWFIGILRSRHL